MAQDPNRHHDITATADSLYSLSRLSGWIAHEINNPLAGIHSAFALIQGFVPVAHPHYKYVEAIEREIARIAALTQRLQQTYRYDEERALTLPPARLIADAIRALEPLRTARGVEVRADTDALANSPPVSGQLIRAAILHLVQHAIESAPPAASIRIGAWCDDDRLWIAAPQLSANPLEARGTSAGPRGLALQLVENIVRALDGEFVTMHHTSDAGEIRIGLPISAPAKEPE